MLVEITLGFWLLWIDVHCWFCWLGGLFVCLFHTFISYVYLLVEGKTEQLTEQLNQSDQLSPEVKQFLPQLLQFASP